MTIKKKLEELAEKAKSAELGGGEEKIEKRHASGKLTARERIDLLLDQGSFQETDRLVVHHCYDFGMEKRRIPGDGIVTGYGTIEGRTVFIFAQDFTVFGGSLSEANASKVIKIMEMAMKAGAPIIGLNDSGGARIQEGVASLAGYAEIFLRNVLASGVIPQISAIMGPCAGGAVYSPAITDFIIMTKEKSNMFITGPDVIREVTHEEVSMEELGGAEAHNTLSGVAHFAAENEEHTLALVREILSFVPDNNMEDPPEKETKDPPDRTNEELNFVVPDDPNLPYDIRKIIRDVLDDQYFFEIQEHYAKNIVIGFGRLAGKPVGIVANQPDYLAGVLDINSSDKGARFIRFCDAFNIPLVTLEDVPGFLPGVSQEHGGIIRHGAKILYAFAEATVPKITLITRKSYGGAYCVMASKHIRADINYAYPTAEIAVMGPEGAVKIVYRRELERAEDPDKLSIKKVEEFRKKFANPYIACEKGYLDEVIEPKFTRPKLIAALEMMKNKRDKNPPKKHGNIPL
ncbi:MAG: acyl-CoA carboxylase subunit beta [Candidatus Aminicenantaceae bacterium]